ncbi:MAG: RNA polymerase sigma factor [Planctomycetota bacterium]|jgi:DNA-directed RNA polymerase specialized sigma24 family protein
MNYAQIADILNINLGTVKSRLSRARSQLREIMEAASK